MQIIYCDQGSKEWHDIRKGVATASNFKKIITPTGKPSKTATKYMRQLARECVIDDPHGYDSKYMEWGRNHEDEARETYALIKDTKIREVGFVFSEFSDLVGCSPDALMDTKGLEIKCPAVDTHVEYMMDGVLPPDYKLQVHGSMVVTGLKKWDFMSFFPGLEPFILEVEWDEFTEEVKKCLLNFADEYSFVKDDIIKTITLKERF